MTKTPRLIPPRTSVSCGHGWICQEKLLNQWRRNHFNHLRTLSFFSGLNQPPAAYDVGSRRVSCAILEVKRSRSHSSLKRVRLWTAYSVMSLCADRSAGRSPRPCSSSCGHWASSYS
jgi:hypothetical protein